MKDLPWIVFDENGKPINLPYRLQYKTTKDGEWITIPEEETLRFLGFTRPAITPEIVVDVPGLAP